MQTKSKNVRLLCLSAVMAALYVGLDFLAVSVSSPFGGTLKLSISGLPVILVAIFGGPLWGAGAGLVGALVGQMITYGFSATTLLWVLPAVVRGLSFGLLYRAFRNRDKVWVLILITCISSVLVTVCNTGAMLIEQKLYGYYSSYVAIFAAIPTRILSGILTGILISVILPALIRPLKKIIKD